MNMNIIIYILSCLLVVSLGYNIFLSVSNCNYKKKIKETKKEILKIINENNDKSKQIEDALKEKFNLQNQKIKLLPDSDNENGIELYSVNIEINDNI